MVVGTPAVVVNTAEPERTVEVAKTIVVTLSVQSTETGSRPMELAAAKGACSPALAMAVPFVLCWRAASLGEAVRLAVEPPV